MRGVRNTLRLGPLMGLRGRVWFGLVWVVAIEYMAVHCELLFAELIPLIVPKNGERERKEVEEESAIH